MSPPVRVVLLQLHPLLPAPVCLRIDHMGCLGADERWKDTCERPLDG